MGALIKPFAGKYSGMLASNGTTDAVSVMVSQTGFNLSVAGTDNGAQFTLNGRAVGAVFDVTGTIVGQAVEYVGIYEPATNDFRVYDTKFDFLGILQPGTISPPPNPISIAVAPTSAALQIGQTQSFTATISNDSQNKGVMWVLSGAGCSGAACGTLSASSSASGAPITYTAPASVPSPATVTLTATSVSDGTKSAAATITVTAAPAAIVVTVSPTSFNVPTGGSQNFTATVQNDSQNKGVTWALLGASCSEGACGTLSATSSASGMAIAYTAPATPPSPATITLKATSVADGTKSADATITVTSAAPAIVVSVSPTPVSVPTGGTQNFTATVQNDSQNKGVNWTLSGTGCSGVTCGTLSANSSASGAAITYTAPARVPSPATVVLTATSVADSTKFSSATITVTAAPLPSPIDLGSIIGPPPLIAVDVNNNIDVVTIDSGNSVEFQQSVDGGSTFSRVSVISPANTPVGVQMALDNQGHATVLWDEWQIATAFVSVSSGGIGFSGPHRVPFADVGCGLDPCTTDPGGPRPQLSVTPSGVINVANLGTVSNPRADISSTRSVDGGATFARTSVAAFDASNLINVAGPQGQEYLVWGSPNGDIYFSGSLDGGQTFGAVVTLSGDTSSVDPYVVVDASGNIHVLWRRGITATDSHNVLMFSRSTDQGHTFSAPIAVVTTTEFIIPKREQLVVEANGVIDIVVTADNHGDGDILFTRSADQGATFSAPVVVGTGDSSAIGLDTCGGINVAWDHVEANNNNIFLSRSTNGSTFSIPANLSNQSSQTAAAPRIAADTRGNTFVVWEQSNTNGNEVFFLLAGTCAQ